MATSKSPVHPFLPLSMKAFSNAPYLLLAIAAMLTSLHLTLIWKSQHHGVLLETCVLCWSATWYLLWRKRQELRLKSTIAASSLGFLLIAWVLLRSALVTGYDSFLRFSPIASGLGLALLASGFALQQYWREFLMLAFLMLPTTTILSQIDISPLTADFGGSLLWYVGVPVSQKGVNLYLPSGSVEVYKGCSGIQSIWQLLTLSFLFVLLFPLGWLRSLLVLVAGVMIAFVVNGIRVALMAVLVNSGNREAFDYWHIGDGSLIFSMVAVILFGILCYVLMEQAEATDEEVDA